MHIQISLEDKIDDYLFGESFNSHDNTSQEEFYTAYTELAVTLEQNNRLLDRVEFCMHSIEQSTSISQFISDNALSLEKVPSWMSNAGKNVGEWFKKAWEFLKEGFLKMIKAIGGFFKKFASIFKKKKASIIRNGKKAKWDQSKADTMTIMTRINPKIKDGDSSPFLTVYNKLIENSQQLSKFSQQISESIKNIPFKDLIISDIDNKTVGEFKKRVVFGFQKETRELFDSVPALKNNASVNQSLYGADAPPAYEHPISKVFTEDDFSNSLQYIDRLDDEIRTMLEKTETSMKESMSIFEELIEFTRATHREREDSEEATEIQQKYMLSTRTTIIQVVNGVLTNFNNFVKIASLCSTEALNLSVILGWILDKLIIGKVEYKGPEPEYF